MFLLLTRVAVSTGVGAMSESIVPRRSDMTAEEYGEAIRDLHRDPVLAKSADQLAEKQFLIDIEFRLGRNFPDDRRELLLVAYRAMRAELSRQMKRFLRATFAPRRHARAINQLNERLLDVFAAILDKEEFQAFTGLDSPSLRSGVVNPSHMLLH